MVAIAHYRLGYEPKPCLAKQMLFAAVDCVSKKDFYGAGIRMREALNRFVIHACDYYGVHVKAKLKTPTEYVRALKKAGQITQINAEIFISLIKTGNACAHCQRINKQDVIGGINILFSMMDGEPYIDKQRVPAVTSKPNCPWIDSMHGKGIGTDQPFCPRDDDEDDDEDDDWKKCPA